MVVAVNRSLVVIEKQNVTISFLVEQAIPPVQPWNLQWLYSSFFNSTSPNGDSITNVTNRTLTSSFSFSAFVNSTSISLTITNVQLGGATGGPTDDGRYFLVATNPAGSSFDYVDLVVEGKWLSYTCHVARLTYLVKLLYTFHDTFLFFDLYMTFPSSHPIIKSIHVLDVLDCHELIDL